MEELDPGNAAPRRIRVASVLTASSAVTVILWISVMFPWFQVRCYEKLKLPMPGITVWFVSIPQAAWWAIALLLGGLFCLKDLWLREKTATVVNHIAVPLFFLFSLLAQAASVLPFFARSD